MARSEVSVTGAFLSIEGLRCVHGVNMILHDLRLQARAGAWVTIMGPSGGGKTTLLRAIAGLHPPAAGAIQIGGRDVTSIKPWERGVSMLFQEPSLWPHLTAREAVMQGVPGRTPDGQRRSRDERRDLAMRALQRLEAGSLAEKRPGEMSGGEARRVELARALCGRPRLLLLDEPVTQLDLHLRGQLLEQLRLLHSEMALTTVCVTHDLHPPVHGIDRLVVLEEGRITADTTFEAMRDKPGALSPYQTALRGALARVL